MVYIRARKFCCCLPVRFGVFFLTVLGTLGGGLLTIVGIITLTSDRKNSLDSNQRITGEISIAVWGLLTAISLLGFIGACTKKRALISIFQGSLVVQLVISIATGIYSLVVLFRRDSKTLIDQCLADQGKSDSDVAAAACRTGLAVGKGLAVGLYVFIWLLSLYAIIIVNNYVEQLEDEEEARMHAQNDPFEAKLQGPPSVVLATTYNSYTPNASAGQYPFTSQNQSFGAAVPPSRGGNYV